MIVLTDGDNNAGNISPEDAARLAQTLKVKIYTILAGAKRIPGRAGRARAATATPVNPKLLEQIASMTGGTPYLATDTAALRDRFQKILEDLKVARRSTIAAPLYAELYPHVPAGRVRAARRRDRAAAHPFSADSLTMRFANPHALWLLLLVPAAVLAYGARVRRAAAAARAPGRRGAGRDA